MLGLTLMAKQFEYHYTPLRGIYWFHLAHLPVGPIVRLSVCRQNGVRSVSSKTLTKSISHFHMLSSNFRKFAMCNCFLQNKKLHIWQTL